jgi:hypothetical protein
MSKRRIPKAVFEPMENFQASDLLDNEALIGMVKREAPLAIEDALKNKKTFASIFEISSSGYYVDIPKSYWVTALEKCISYKLEEENFEDCISLKKLIDDINKAQKTISTKQPKKKKDGARIDGDSISDQ